MTSLTDYTLNFNKNLKVSINGGNLSSDTGLLIPRSFDEALGLSHLIDACFPKTAKRCHSTADVTRQLIYTTIAGYHADDASDHIYCVAHIKPSGQDIYNATATYFCNVIMQDFRETFAFSNNQSIFVLFNVSHIQESRDSYFKQINRLIKDGNFRVGYSHYAEGLSNLKVSLDFN